MNKSARASFLHFVFSFVIFISLSVSLTVLVGKYSLNQVVENRAAAARTIMLHQDTPVESTDAQQEQ